VAVLLCNVRAMARVVGVQPMGFLGPRCRLVVGVVAIGINDYAVGVVVDKGSGYVEVMVVGVVDGGFGQAELPASGLID
jgi:hypothetical protein